MTNADLGNISRPLSCERGTTVSSGVRRSEVTPMPQKLSEDSAMTSKKEKQSDRAQSEGSFINLETRPGLHIPTFITLHPHQSTKVSSGDKLQFTPGFQEHRI
ncbi:uncharacterized protein V6R79_019420 [Siganus canaliculatus]